MFISSFCEHYTTIKALEESKGLSAAEHSHIKLQLPDYFSPSFGAKARLAEKKAGRRKLPIHRDLSEEKGGEKNSRRLGGRLQLGRRRRGSAWHDRFN